MAVDMVARALAQKAGTGSSLLDSNGKLISSALPDSILGSVNYRGTWDASTNTPTIPTAATANKGYYYVVSIAGNTSINSINTWDVGNWIISDGTAWSKIATQQKVSSVSNKTGAVMLDKTDVNLGNVQNIDTTNADNLSSGTVNISRLPIATSSSVGIMKAGNGLNVDTTGLVTSKLGIGLKFDGTYNIIPDTANIDVTSLKNFSTIVTGIPKGFFGNGTTLSSFSSCAKGDFYIYNGTSSLTLGGYTFNSGDQLWCTSATSSVPANLTNNFAYVPESTAQATTTNFGTIKLGSITPLDNATTASVGVSQACAREDHVHKNVIMTGATSTTNGTSGSVPVPSSGQQNSFLRGDGSWVNVSTIIDNSSSHYIDIGNVRIQWGNTSGTSITFPVPFKDTSYTCNPTVELNNNSTLTSVFITAKSPTAVTLQKSWYNGGSWGTSLTCNVGWIAVGLKP